MDPNARLKRGDLVVGGMIIAVVLAFALIGIMAPLDPLRTTASVVIGLVGLAGLVDLVRRLTQ